MVDGMKKMTHWHTKSFNASPIGDGYEVEVNEFDYNDDNGICYEKNGVTVRHWRRSHNMDGASAYRLDWNGLSFVWTGDGRPDELTLEYAKDVDVFVTELQPDLGKIMEQKTGVPQGIYNSTIDIVHTDHYATGYMIKHVNPRLGMVTHMAFDRDLVSEPWPGSVALERVVLLRRPGRRGRQRHQGHGPDARLGGVRLGQHEGDQVVHAVGAPGHARGRRDADHLPRPDPAELETDL